MVETLAKLERARLARLAVIIACVVCPGFIFLYQFKSGDFLSLDFSKLLMLALAISLPIYLANFLPAIVIVELTIRGVSADALIYATSEKSPTRKDDVRNILKSERQEANRRTDVAMYVAAANTFIAIYSAVVAGRCSDAISERPILTLIVIATVTSLVCSIAFGIMMFKSRRNTIALPGNV